MSNVSELLSRLNKTLKKEKDSKKNNSSFDELKKLKEKDFYKMQEGVNKFVFITPANTEDPFKEWAYHAGLQEVSWYTNPCMVNFNKECTICNAIKSLQKDYEKNRGIWYPIRQQFEYYAPVINVESSETIAEGVKWLRLTKNPMSTMFDWLKNLEKDELPFYSDEEPQKVLITYNPSAIPAEKYKLDKKNSKPFSEDQLDEWRSSIRPITDYFTATSEDRLSKMLDEYLIRIEEAIINSQDDDGEEVKKSEETKVVSKKPVETKEDDEEEEKVTKKASSRLASLKSK